PRSRRADRACDVAQARLDHGGGDHRLRHPRRHLPERRDQARLADQDLRAAEIVLTESPRRQNRTKKEQGCSPCSFYPVSFPILLVAEIGAAAGERAEDFFPPKTWTAFWSRSCRAGILLPHGRAQASP